MLIRTSRFQEYAKRILNLPGGGLAGNVLNEPLIQNFPVLDAAAPELSLPRGDRLWGVNAQINSAAGQVPTFFVGPQQIVAADPSPWLSMVELLIVKCTVAGECILYMVGAPPPIGGILAGTLLDTRTQPSPSQAIKAQTAASSTAIAQAPPANSQEWGRFDVPTPGNVILTPKVVLQKGFSFAIQFNVVGVSILKVSASGRERLLEPGESAP